MKCFRSLAKAVAQALLALVILFPQLSLGADYVDIKRATPVFDEPDDESIEITELEKGDRVPISPKEYNGYRKVLIKVEGQRKAGYIRNRDLQGQKVRTRDEMAGRKSSWHRRYGVGLAIAATYSSQAARKITESEGASVQVGEMQGTSSYFGFFGEVPVHEQWSASGSLLMRKSSMSGSARFSSVQDTPVGLTQQFIGAALTGKYYFDPRGDLWLGLRTEVSKANTVDLVYSQTNSATVDKSNNPLFILPQLAAGYDYQVFSNFFLLPELRAGAVVNAQPMICIVDVTVGLGYQF
jgi:hypothetical protein